MTTNYTTQTSPYTDYTGWLARWAGIPPTYPTTGPPAPYWLPRFAPGQVAGQPMTRQGQMPIPSAQQWRRTPWSVQQGLGGYAEWEGLSPLQDLLDYMNMMLPRTPYGAYNRSWMPFRR